MQRVERVGSPDLKPVVGRGRKVQRGLTSTLAGLLPSRLKTAVSSFFLSLFLSLSPS
jgi:hypothetical protein